MDERKAHLQPSNSIIGPYILTPIRVAGAHKMAWTKDTIIALIALFAACAPIFFLVASILIRRRHRRGETNRKCLDGGRNGMINANG